MISSLEDAWQWYESARKIALVMKRLGEKHWDGLPWETSGLGRDEHLKTLLATDLLDGTRAVIADLDDLCVLLLFSVFEAIVRNQVLVDVAAELPTLRHAAVRHAVETMREGIEHGSFFRVLEPYKGQDHTLIEEVNQVRRYGNWVAHGRRGSQPASVDPHTAYQRLQRFLGQLRDRTRMGWPAVSD